MRKRPTRSDTATVARATLEPVATLTAALVSYLDGDFTKTTAAELYAIEAIAMHLRRAMTRPNTVIAVCSLIDTLPLTDPERRRIESFIQKRQRARR